MYLIQLSCILITIAYSSAKDNRTLLEDFVLTESFVPDQYLIADYIFKKYNPGFIPFSTKTGAINVSFSMELYQLIEVNEPQQYVLLNSWIVERWVDHLLGWDPDEFNGLTQIVVPYSRLWMPDTTLYNSLVMDDTNSRRLLNVKVTTRGKNNGALIELLYPTIYKFSCLLDLRFFPFDMQECVLTFGSWTFDNTFIDYHPFKDIGTSNCIENEGWEVVTTKVRRVEKKYSCCPNKYTLLQFHLKMQRKPLYYIVNLIIPTSIITLISIVGFFSSPSINDLREEKITLGITTLLSMSILVFMISDKMPSTSSFIPLIGWFYTSMILLISLATLFASIVIYVQKQGCLGKPPPPKYMKAARYIAKLVRMEMPLVMKQAYARKNKAALRRLTRAFAFDEEEGRKRGSIWHRVFSVVSQPVIAKTNSEAPIVINDPVTLDPVMAMDSSVHSGETSFTMGSNRYSSASLAKYNLLRNPSTFTYDGSNTPMGLSTGSQRDIAQLEYDWLAAVVERVFLIFFIIAFLFSSVGINLVGLYFWILKT